MKIKMIIQNFILNHVSNIRRAELVKKWHGVKFGTGCEVYKDVYFGSEPYLIEIGDHVRITSGVKFCTHDGGMWVIRKLDWNKNADLFGKIKIGNNVHIGWNTVIMPGVTIGNNVVIGVGSVVTHDIPDNSVCAGVPAKVIRNIQEYYAKNKDKIVETKGMSAEQKKEFILNVNQ